MATLTRLSAVPVERIPGLAGKRGTALAAAGVRSVADLLHVVPRRYVDRSRVEPVSLLPVGEEVTVVARVASVATRRPRRGLTIVEARLTDGTGVLRAVWFNQAFRERQLAPGTEVALSGKVERYRGSVQMSSPDVDVLGGEGLRTGRVVPVHPGIGDAGPAVMRRALHEALARSRPFDDPVPEDVRRRLGLAGRDEAMAAIHFPESLDDVGPARRRLAFDELFRLEIALALTKSRREETEAGIAHPRDGEIVSGFLAGLPYPLTGAQRRVLDEISADLASPRPMHRLLQGEVGSGKTVVAVAALLAGVDGGFQGAVMAPTEVLAVQHYLGITGLLADAGLAPETEGRGEALGMASLFASGAPAVRVGLLTAGQVASNVLPGAGREDVLAAVAAGRIDVVVGTHALIQEGVGFARLGIAVVDEQHRFGVSQRVSLKEKAGEVSPDLLIMTATPIPRTLAMTLYGDLETSIIDEMPAGRRPVETRLVSRAEEGTVWELVRAEVAAGRQAFVVCPLVEDSEKLAVASATAEHARLVELLAGIEVGLLHGQQPARAKAEIMDAFRAGEVDVLVATTVIEVGIDVPNATVIVIEDADRFGLSQLHQLRGRVGRGRHPGTCLLLADPSSPDAVARLEAMVATTDGFRLAEEDLRIRGQGTVFGTRQSGLADLRIADILVDAELLVAARREAFALVAADPALTRHPELAAEVKALLGEAVEWLFVS